MLFTDSISDGRSYMDTQQIISELEAERDRLEQAISALRGSLSGGRGFASAGRGRRGRRLSAAAKRRISEMMKKRWAERKRAAKAA